MNIRVILSNIYKLYLLLTNSRISSKRLDSRITILLLLLAKTSLYSSLLYRKLLHLRLNDIIFLIFYELTLTTYYY